MSGSGEDSGSGCGCLLVIILLLLASEKTAHLGAGLGAIVVLGTLIPLIIAFFIGWFLVGRGR